MNEFLQVTVLIYNCSNSLFIHTFEKKYSLTFFLFYMLTLSWKIVFGVRLKKLSNR